MFQGKLAELGVRLQYSSVAHPQTNGQAEVSNRTLLKAIAKKVHQSTRSWSELIPEILWSYRTTVHSSTGETPYSLTYGSEAILPIDITSLSSRLAGINLDDNEHHLRAELDIIEARRELALIRSNAAKLAMAQVFDQRVKPKKIQVGKLVLRNRRFETGTSHHKLQPKWEGPYVVTDEIRPGTYKLATTDGRPLPNPWHAEHLRRYHHVTPPATSR